MKTISAVFAALLLTACASSSRTGYLPPVSDPANAAQVTMVRNKNLYRAGLVAKVTLDGFVIARLGADHHVTFPVEAGRHSLGITESAASLDLQAGEDYYFLISVIPGGQGFESERIPAGIAQEYLADSTAVQ